MPTSSTTADNHPTTALGADILCCVAIVSLCLYIGLPRYLGNIDLRDEGFLAYGAVRVLEGQIPNRDFVSLQPPLSFYTVALVFKLFGTSLQSLRAFGLSIYGSLALAVYLLSRHLTGRTAALMAAMLATFFGMPFFDFVPFAVWQGTLACAVSALCMLRAARHRRLHWAFLAGITTAFTALLRHDQALYLCIAIVVFILFLRLSISSTARTLKPQRLSFAWAGGAWTVMLPVMAYWLYSGAISAIYEQLVLFPLLRYRSTSSRPMPVFSSELTSQQTALVSLFYIPLLIEGATFAWLLVAYFRRRLNDSHGPLLFILVLAALYYCQVLTRSDLYHLLITLSPLFVLCGWWIETISRSRRFASAAALVAIGVFGTWLGWQTTRVFLFDTEKPVRVLALDNARLNVEPRLAASLEFVVDEIRRHADPGSSILSLPYQPMYYFLAQRRNPTHWNYLWPGDQTAGDHDELVRQARQDPPAVVVITGREQVRSYAPTVVEYIERNYGLAEAVGETSLYLDAK